jgi:hypothetical protein
MPRVNGALVMVNKLPDSVALHRAGFSSEGEAGPHFSVMLLPLMGQEHA